MTWLLFAFSGPILWAASTHIDKYLVEQYFKRSHVAVLLIFTALIGIVPLPFIWFFDPQAIEIPLRNVIIIGFSGILYMGAMYFYLRALQNEEASVVAPFFQTSPLFSYALAYVVLGETLTVTQMLGGGLIVCGALMISLQFGKHRRTRFRPGFVFLMVAAAFSLALSSVIFKLFAVEDEFWSTTFWMFVGEILFGIGLLASAENRRQFFGLFRSHPWAMTTINAANELINLGGGLGARYAMILAPLSLVQAITSTSTLFVFAFGVVLSRFFPRLARENLSRGSLLQKGAAAALVVGGVILVT